MKVIRSLSSGTFLMLIVLTLVLAVSSVLESVLIKYLSDAVITGDRKLFLLMFLAVPVYLIVDTFFITHASIVPLSLGCRFRIICVQNCSAASGFLP